MKNKRQIAINTQLWLPISMFIIFIGIAMACLSEKNYDVAIGFFVATALPIFVFLISPMYYAFSEDGVEIRYLFGQKEDIRWDSIKKISLLGGWGKHELSPYFHIAYPTSKKLLFFMQGVIYS